MLKLGLKFYQSDLFSSFFFMQLWQTNDDLLLSPLLMLIRRPDVSHRQHGSLIRPRPLMIPELTFMNLATAKQTWQQFNCKTTETAGCVWWIDTKHHQIEITPPHQLDQAAGAGARGQRSGSKVSDPWPSDQYLRSGTPFLFLHMVTPDSAEASGSAPLSHWIYCTLSEADENQTKENAVMRGEMADLPVSTATWPAPPRSCWISCTPGLRAEKKEKLLRWFRGQ